MATLNISKKRKFVADGVFYSELNEVSNWNGEVWIISHKLLLPHSFCLVSSQLMAMPALLSRSLPLLVQRLWFLLPAPKKSSARRASASLNSPPWFRTGKCKRFLYFFSLMTYKYSFSLQLLASTSLPALLTCWLSVSLLVASTPPPKPSHSSTSCSVALLSAVHAMVCFVSWWSPVQRVPRSLSPERSAVNAPSPRNSLMDTWSRLAKLPMIMLRLPSVTWWCDKVSSVSRCRSCCRMTPRESSAPRLHSLMLSPFLNLKMSPVVGKEGRTIRKDWLIEGLGT